MCSVARVHEAFARARCDVGRKCGWGGGAEQDEQTARTVYTIIALLQHSVLTLLSVLLARFGCLDLEYTVRCRPRAVRRLP